MYILSRIVIGVILGIQSCLDLRYRKIPTSVSIIGAIMGILLSAISGRSARECMIAVIPGCVFILLSKITRDAIGMGDAMLVVVLAAFYSIKEISYICMAAFFCSSMAALVLIVVFRKKGNYELPFVPFIGIGWMMEFLYRYGEM